MLGRLLSFWYGLFSGAMNVKLPKGGYQPKKNRCRLKLAHFSGRKVRGSICFVHLNKRIIQGCCTTYQNSTFHNISQNLSNSYEFNKCKTIFYNISFILDDACFKITNFSDGTFFLNFHHKKSLQLHAAAIWRP